MAPLVTALKARGDFKVSVVVTGQHREMLDQVNEIFAIEPDFDLDISMPRQTLAGITVKSLEGVTNYLRIERPDAIVVQGDTTTAMSAGLAAFYEQIPVVHLEAGLRSGDMLSPFPEEANRRILTLLATLHLAPTSESRNNLIAEGIDPAMVVVTGNTVIDALLHTAEQDVRFTDARLTRIADEGRKVLLVTIHRRENHATGTRNVGRALALLAKKYPDIQIVLPIHPNPAVRDAILPEIGDAPNVLVTEPLAYGQFTRLLRLSHLVLTDSGGIQEEAPAFGKPVLVLRANTERPEAVTAGTARLIGTDTERIVDEVTNLLENPVAYAAMARAINPYGDGKAATRAAAAIAHMLLKDVRPADFVA